MARVYQDINKIDLETERLLKDNLSEEFNFEIPELPYPDDKETKEELEYLLDIAKNCRSELSDIIRMVDNDLTTLFFGFLKIKGMTLSDNQKLSIAELINKSVPFLLKVKYKYNRPRPWQDAKFFKIDFWAMESSTSNTPSYPSGHTFQAYLIADFLSKIFPEKLREFYDIAEKIGITRIIGGYHYPSDNKYSQILFKEYKSNEPDSRGLDSSLAGLFDTQVVQEKLEFNDLKADIKDFIFKQSSKDDLTDFPKKGDNLKVSLSNSNWDVFPVSFADKIKKDYPEIWKKGGNIKGNDQYRDLVPVQNRGGNVVNKKEEDAVRLRESWVARHFKNFRIEGVIAQIKWLAVGSKGLNYMKNLVRDEMKKIDGKVNLGKVLNEDFEILEVGSQENKPNSYLIKSKTPQKLSMYIDYIQVRDMTPDETRDLGNKKDNNFLIKGIASSTSVDHYGTEMSLGALKSMEDQIANGVVILPRHESMSGGAGIAEWDEVIGRTLSAKIVRSDVKNKDGSKIGHVLEVTSQLFGEDNRTKNLMRRLNRGELIGQSIGGWFENVRVEEGLSGEIERVIVEDVTLDHIAITRAPANPDSYGLSLLNVRNKLQSFLKGRNKMNSNETEELLEDISASTDCLEKRNFDELATVEDPLSGEKMTHGDAKADDSNAQNPFEIAHDDIEKVREEERRDVMDEDLQEKEDHYKGGEDDDVDQIEKLEEDEDYDKEKREEYERMKENFALMKEEMERMKKEMERMKEMKLDQSEFDEGKESEGTKLYDEDVINSLRSALPFVKMSIAPIDVEWNWDAAASNNVLGDDNWNRFAKAHLYRIDDSNFETKSAYRLPIAKMIDGELKIVFRALVAVMGALNGARNGVKLTKEDRSKVYENLAKYYSLFDKEAPELRSYEECFDDGYEVGYEEGYENASEKLSKSTQDTDNKFDNKTNLNHAFTDGEGEAFAKGKSNNPERYGENIMEPKELQSIIEQVTRSVVETLSTNTPQVKEEEPIDSVADLKARLDRAEFTLAKVMETPVRAGRHLSTTISGIGSRSAFEDLANRSQQGGNVALSCVVQANLDKLSNDNISKLSNHELRSLLAAGLRGAQQDGLLGTPVAGWQ